MNSKRILTLLSFIKESDKIIDVGCDHGYISKLLEKRGQSSIASDINEQIIDKRKKEGSKLIKYYVSDGLKEIKEYFDYPILSGMGTFTILNILKSSDLNFSKCLMCSNSDNESLRKGMLSLGFIVKNEKVIKEKDKYYNIIMFEKGKYNYTKKELYIGINHLDKDMLKEKNDFLLDKYTKLLKTIPKSKQQELKRKIEYLK